MSLWCRLNTHLSRFARRPLVLSDAKSITYAEALAALPSQSRGLGAFPAPDPTDTRLGVVGLVAALRDARCLVLGAGTPPSVPAGAALLLSTSGTTGAPRWLAFGAAQVFAAVRMSWAALGTPDETERWLAPLPTSHAGGFMPIVRVLLVGGAWVPYAGGGLDVSRWCALGAANHVTRLSIVPVQLSRLVAERKKPWPGLVSVWVGGDATNPQMLQAARDLGWPMAEVYGQSETLGAVAVGARAAYEPLPRVRWRVENAQLAIRAPSLANRVWAEGRWQPLGLSADGWHRTGDRAAAHGSGFRIIGRERDLIISGGHNIDPVRVETALRDQGMDAPTLVFGVPDPVWGQVVACAVVADGNPCVAWSKVQRAAAALPKHIRPRRAVLVADLACFQGVGLEKPSRQRAGARLADALRPLESATPAQWMQA